MAESRSKVPQGMFSRSELQELVNRCRTVNERWTGDLGMYLRRLQCAAANLEQLLAERGFAGPAETKLPGG